MQVKDLIDHAEKRILAAQKAEEDLANHYRAVEEGLARMFTPVDKFKTLIDSLREAGEFRIKAMESLVNPCKAVTDGLNRLAGPMLILFKYPKV